MFIRLIYLLIRIAIKLPFIFLMRDLSNSLNAVVFMWVAAFLEKRDAHDCLSILLM